MEWKQLQLESALRILSDAGHHAEPVGDIPGLYRVGVGPELTVNQIIGWASLFMRPPTGESGR